MKLSPRGWIYAFFGGLIVLNVILSWGLFTGFSAAPGRQPAAWQIVIYLMLLIVAGAFLAYRLARRVAPSRAGASAFVSAEDEECKRLVYVGADSFREGRTCGELMGQALGGRGKIAIVTREHGQHLQIRKSGFLSILEEKYPQLRVVASVGEVDRDVLYVSQQLTEILDRTPDLAGIYVLDGNTPRSVIKTLVETGRVGKIKLICHDMVDETMRGVVDGTVTCTLSQDPFAQGYDPVMYLYNYLVAGQKPPRPKMTTQMIRITQENYRQYWDPQRGVIETDVSRERRVRPVDKRPEQALRIVVLGIEPEASPFFAPVKEGVLAAAEVLKKYNTTVEWVDPARVVDKSVYDANSFGPVIDAYRVKKYDAIATLIYDKHIVSYVNRAVDAGIPVAVFNSEPESVSSLMTSLINQSRDLLDITVALAQSALESGQSADQINDAISAMKQALTLESTSAIQAIESTQQIAQAISGIDRGAMDQTVAASHASNATRDISQAVEGTRQASAASEKTSVQAAQVARQGAETIQQTLRQISEISTAVNSSAEQIHALSQISRQIDSIVGTVNDIAEQTNLLALNANIEAARAGENGRGFSVVATEIRSLAEQSKKSTKEIAALVRAVQKNSDKMVETVDEATRQASTGSQLASQAGQALDSLVKAAEAMREQTEQVVSANASVVQSLQRLTDANQRVSAVIVENAASIRQVTRNIEETVERVNHMTGISQDNVQTIEGIHTLSDQVAGQSEQLKSSIASLVQMAEELQGAVVAFKLNQKT